MATIGGSLVIGANGVLGRSVAERLRSLGNWVVGTSRRPTAGNLPLDILAMAASWEPPAGITTAYFCAAVTSQSLCRKSFDCAHAVNVTATVSLIRRLLDAGIFVVFPSTNLVFDGSQPHVLADAATCPRTAYGRMKAEAEMRLLALGGVGVVRLTKVVHDHLPVFAHWRTSLTQSITVHPFHDMVFSPLLLHDAVSILVAVGQNRLHGLMQGSAKNDISYAEACRLLAHHLHVAESQVKPVSWQGSDERLEHVPDHTTLDTSRAEEICGLVPRAAEAALEEVFTALTTVQRAT
jgi:dTDP-4-dehydrorhamnose reductase